jgi:hypothetical protein
MEDIINLIKIKMIEACKIYPKSPKELKQNINDINKLNQLLQSTQIQKQNGNN